MTDPYEGAEGLRTFVDELTAWLDEHDAELPRRAPGASFEDEVARSKANQAVLWDAGWLRHGWPEAVGGLGGSSLLRTAVAEAGADRSLFYDTQFAVAEVLVPTVVSFAPNLAEYVAPMLRGDQGWCQGFSEPDAGSDLASLRCRAVDEGDHWVVSGQKIWTSYAQFATRIVLLARTGTPESRHRGITAMLVDMDTPGLTVQLLHAMNGTNEFSEVFFDGVVVPKDRVIGEIDGGWAVAMDMLRSERGGIFWMLSTWLLNALRNGVSGADLGPADDEALGRALASVAGLRARTWTTQHRIANGVITTPETSIDKVLMATSEQEVWDLLRDAGAGQVEFGDDDASEHLRSEYMYSRAASIYGGSAEIQRNILADQVLGFRGAK